MRFCCFIATATPKTVHSAIDKALTPCSSLHILLPPNAAGCGGGGSAVDFLHKEGNWYEPKYGEGASCFYCHVIIPKSHYAMLPPKRPDEVEHLNAYPFQEDMTDT
jgi:hypothetical protein